LPETMAASAEEPVAKRQKVDGMEGGAMEEPAHMDTDAGGASASTKSAATNWAKPPPHTKALEAEKETDAILDKRKKLKGPVVFHPQDTTLNVMVSTGGNILRCLSDTGLRHFMGGARASRGIKSGRYMFEVTILELLAWQDENPRDPQPRRTVRVGFTTESSSSIIGETEESIGFDSEGFLWQKGQKMHAQGFSVSKLEVLGIVLNLDPVSPNANTVSLFRGGTRLTNPVPLPESLCGKTLYPTVSFRNATVQWNFGPAPTDPLPFKCLMISDAAEKDAADTKPYSPPKDGKFEVMLPVCMPDEGVFDWADWFLAKNPHFTEISSRMMARWADASGVKRYNARGTQLKTGGSNDEVESQTGIKEVDDGTIRQTLEAMIPIQRRSFLIIRIKAALMKEERAALLQRLGASHKIAAHIMVAEPPKELRQRIHEVLLKEKQQALEVEFNRKKEIEKKALLDEKKKKALAAASGAGTDEDATMRDEGQEHVEKEAEAKEGEDVNPAAASEPLEEQDVIEEAPPQAELTEDELGMTFRKLPLPDLLPAALSKSFKSFSYPLKDEGFDEVKYAWAEAKKAEEYLKSWIADRKVTIRMDHIQPGQWFNERRTQWNRAYAEWQKLFSEVKTSKAKKEAEKQAKLNSKLETWATAIMQTRKKDLETQLTEAHQKERAELGVDPLPQKEAETGEDAETPPEDVDMSEFLAAHSSAADMDADELKFEQLDIFGVDDIADIGTGEPMFKNFLHEDWAMMSFRFEMHLLLHSFQRDVSDPEYLGIFPDHLAFYYNKYYKRVLNLKMYGVDSLSELLALIQDTVLVPRGSKVIMPLLPEEIENLGVFVMLTEQARRERLRLVDLGDTSAKLNIQEPQQQQQQQPTPAQRQGPPGGAVGVQAGPNPWAQWAGAGWGGPEMWTAGPFWTPPTVGGFMPPWMGGGGWPGGPKGGKGMMKPSPRVPQGL